mgnify:CR=1 FL=1
MQLSTKQGEVAHLRNQAFLIVYFRQTYIVLLLAWSAPLAAQDIYFAFPVNSAVKTQEKIALFQSLVTKDTGWWSEIVSPKTAGKLSGKNNIIVSIGQAAFQTALQGKGSSPVIALFIHRNEYFSTIKKYPTKRNVSSIYSDPSAERQLALIKVIYGKSAKASIIETPYSLPIIDQYRRAAEKLDVNLSVIRINESDNFSLSKEITRRDTLILNNDPDLFQHLPLDSLRFQVAEQNHKGLVGFSSGMVKSGGGLATTYTSFSSLSEETRKLIQTLMLKNVLPDARYPKFFAVEINHDVLDLLDLIPISEESATDQIKSLLAADVH